MPEATFDLCILGGGPGGYVAAIRASQLGLKVGLVEREHLGGICLNWGCIPTKALLRASEIYQILQHADEFGFRVGDVGFDLEKVVGRSRRVAKRLSAGVKHLLKKNGVEVFDGHGRLAGAGRVSVTRDGEAVAEIAAPHVILATGARARSLPGIEPDGDRIWTYKEAMVPKSMPGSLLVIGSGAIGIEFASFYRGLGAEVTVVEILPQILPAEDAEIAALARKSFEKQGIRFLTDASVESLDIAGDRLRATLQQADGESETLEADRAILAVGIVGNVEDTGLDTTAARVEKSHLVVDEWLQTDEPGVYGIGDLVGPPWLAHKAMHEGVLCVEKIAGVEGVHALDTSLVPGCTYSSPQIASIGMTEEEASEQGVEVKIGRFPYVGNGKAIAMGESEGLIKTIFDAGTGELLGAHMVGAEVTELIQGYSIARTLESTEAELIKAIFPHPTLSEGMHEAVLAAFGRALHI